MRQHRIGTWALSLLVAVGGLGMPGGAWAQDDPSRTFGTSATISHTLQAFAFGGFKAADYALFESTSAGSRSCESPCFYETALLLPAGALLVSVELDACMDPNGSATLKLFRVGKPENVDLLTTASTSGTPGCTTVTSNLTTPHTIDNVTNTYWVEVSLPGGNLARFQAVRVFYRLQVSPAPAVASFGDVPTNYPFFQFIEALAASGITSGCQSSPPLYCPDQALTRGQMAVFLSKALGLHFAP
jgi:hypothetical protein